MRALAGRHLLHLINNYSPLGLPPLTGRSDKNKGSHWVSLVIDDNKQAIYFDSYGLETPKEIKNLFKSNQYKIGNTTKNIQSLMSNLCISFVLVIYIP